MSYADEKGKLDELVEGPRGVKVLVENKALMHVVGTRMDYVTDRLRCVLGTPRWWRLGFAHVGA